MQDLAEHMSLAVFEQLEADGFLTFPDDFTRADALERAGLTLIATYREPPPRKELPCPAPLKN